MLITREMDYAIRIVRSLKKNEKRSAVEITQEEQVPLSFAYKVLKKLSKAKIVEISRGANGGYILNPKLIDLNLYDIIYAVDSEFLVTECLHKNYSCPNNQEDRCLVHKEFLEIQNIIEKKLKNISIDHI